MSSPSDPIDSASLAAIAAALATGFGSQPDQEQAGTVKQTTDALTCLPRDWPQEVPAKLTAWDAGTQRATWVERDWDANGLRKDKLRGLFGNATTSPAVPVGNGLMPPDSFPVDVILRRRCAVKGLGVVYEFDWVCACAGAGSGGTGSGADGILTACCGGALPRPLHGTFAVTAGTCTGYGGASVVLTWTDGIGPTGSSPPTSTAGGWRGTVSLNGHDTTWSVFCVAGGFEVEATSAGGCTWTLTGSTALFSCAPLHVLFTKNYDESGSGGCCSAGSTITLTVTE